MKYPRTKMVKSVLACVCCCVLATQAQDIIDIGNTGANTGLDTNTPRTWNFAITMAGQNANLAFSRALLGLNAGSKTTNDVVMTLFNGFGGTGPILLQVDVPYSIIGQTFTTNTAFTFTSTQLLAGAYSVQFTTAAGSSGGQQYGLKQGALVLTDGNGVALPSSYWAADTTTTGLATTNFAATDVLADYRLSTTNIVYGNFRINSVLSTSVNLTNTAIYTSNNGTERLFATNTFLNNSTISGLTTNLLAVNQFTNFTVGLNSASAGTNLGTVTLTYYSYTNGTAASRVGGPTNVGSQVISLSGVGYRLASSGLSATNRSYGNYHLGDTLSTSFSLTNMSASDGFSERLGVSTNSISGNLTVSGGPIGLLSAQSNASITVGMSSGSIGTNTGSFTLAFTSDGTGTSGFSASNLGSQVVSVSGVGYRLAAAQFVSTNLDLGRIHEGGTFSSQYLTVSNIAASSAFTETLGVSFGTATGGATGSGSVTNIAAGASNNSSLLVGLSDNSAGTKNGTLQLNPTSREVNGSGLGTSTLTGQTVMVTGFAYTGRAYWNTNGGGSWSSFTNWDHAGGTPGLDGVLSTNDTATFAAGPTSGTTTVNLNGASPVVSSIVFSNTSSSYTIATGSGGSLTVGTAGYAGSISVSGGSHTISAPIALARDTSVETAYTNTTLTISSAISGSGKQLTKRGPGWLILSYTNTYTGPTIVNGGKLSVNGSLASGAVTVQTGATLAGTGSIGGPTTIQNGGTLSPGNSPGIITFTNGVTFDSGSTLDWELIGNTAASSQRGTSYDGINLTGGTAQIDANAWLNLIFTNSGSTVSWMDPFWGANQSWMVITNSNLATVVGTFTKINVGTDANSLSLSDVRPGAYFYTSLDASNDLMLNYVTAVPEPSALALLVTGWAVIAAGGRRRHRLPGGRGENSQSGSAENQEEQTPRSKFQAFGPVILSLGLVSFSTGCGQMWNLVNVPPREKDPILQVAYGTVDSDSQEEVGAFENVDVSTESGALRAYFKGKRLLGSAYFACDEVMASHYADAAGKCIEDSLKFYARDLENMTRGQKPIHASVNWDFLKGAHEVWSASVALSGRHVEMKQHIDENAGDAWALLIISQMARDKESEEERRKLIEDKYSEVKEFLEREHKFAEQLSVLKRSAAGDKPPATTKTVALAGVNKGSVKNTFSLKLASAKPAKTGIAAGDARVEGKLVAADPITGKAAFSVRVALSQPALGGQPVVVLERGERSNQ